MNQTVQATNMQIKASVPTQLLIKGSASGAEFKSAIDFTAAVDSAKYQSNAALTNVPATAYKGRNESGTAALINTASEWKKLTLAGSPYVKVDGTINGGAQDATWDTINASYFEAAAANSYDSVNDEAIGDYIKDTFTLKLVGNTVSGSSVKVTFTATTTDAGTTYGTGTGETPLTDIYKAIHIAFATTSDSGHLYEIDLGNGALTYDTGVATITVTDYALLNFSSANEEIEYTLYIWYDGEDDQCRNAFAERIDQLKYDFTFTYGA